MDSNGTETNGHSVGHEPKSRLYRRKARTKQVVQAASLQFFAYESAMALKDSCVSADTGKLVMTPATALCVHKLIGAWDTAADRLRVLRGKGLPASVKPVKGGSGGQVKPLDQA
jgi:hypothetical protein